MAPVGNIRTRENNLITQRPGPRLEAIENNSKIDILNLFIDANITKLITDCTNTYIDFVRANFEQNRDARLTNEVEIRGFIGILYLIGVLRCSRKNVSQLWDNSTGNRLESCYSTMSEKRFHFLVRCVRFDNINDTAARKEFDKLASIREVFDLMVQNSQKYYSPSEYVTVDEQLLAFRGKCPFRQYIFPVNQPNMASKLLP